MVNLNEGLHELVYQLGAGVHLHGPLRITVGPTLSYLGFTSVYNGNSRLSGGAFLHIWLPLLDRGVFGLHARASVESLDGLASVMLTIGLGGP
jgi:hypothetical protein